MAEKKNEYTEKKKERKEYYVDGSGNVYFDRQEYLDLN